MAITSIPAEIRSSKRDAAFWRRVSVGRPDECWLWKSEKQINQSGYGTAFYGTIRTTAQRVAYMIAKGSIPEGLEILHSCDVRRCCNPDHLRPGTSQDNSDDMVERGRWSRATSFAGDGNPNAKVSEAQLPQIFEDAKTMSQRALAAKYGVSKSQIGNILRGESRAQAVDGVPADSRDAASEALYRRNKRKPIASAPERRRA